MHIHRRNIPVEVTFTVRNNIPQKAFTLIRVITAEPSGSSLLTHKYLMLSLFIVSGLKLTCSATSSADIHWLVTNNICLFRL